MPLLLLIIWPIAELLVAIEVAQLIGVLLTVLLLIAGLPVGSWLLRSEGRAAWRRLSAAVAAGRPPGKEAADGALVVAGGVALMIPGFITDVIGVVLLIPGLRALARRTMIANFQNRWVVSAVRFGGGSRPYDVDSTATEIDPTQLHR
jgi:UPF0716 protein FxsA